MHGILPDSGEKLLAQLGYIPGIAWTLERKAGVTSLLIKWPKSGGIWKPDPTLPVAPFCDRSCRPSCDRFPPVKARGGLASRPLTTVASPPKKPRKSPSTKRRDQARLRAWKDVKRQQPVVPPLGTLT